MNIEQLKAARDAGCRIQVTVHEIFGWSALPEWLTIEAFMVDRLRVHPDDLHKVPQGWGGGEVETCRAIPSLERLPDGRFPPAAFEEWFAAIEAGDGSIPVPQSIADGDAWHEHIGRRQIALGAWIAATQVNLSTTQARPEVRVNFPQVGTAGPFPVVDDAITLPDETMNDLIRHARTGYEQARPSAPVVAYDRRWIASMLDMLNELLRPDYKWSKQQVADQAELLRAAVITQQPAKPEGPAVDVLRISAQPGLDSITVYFEDYGPGQGRATVFCYGDAWTACWGAMGNLTVREFVASVDPDYLACAFLQLCDGDDRRREYTGRIATAIVEALRKQPAKANEPEGE